MAMAMAMATATATATARGMAMTRAMVVATATGTTMPMPMVMVRLQGLFWVIVKATKLLKILRNLERKMLIKTTSYKKNCLTITLRGQNCERKGE